MKRYFGISLRESTLGCAMIVVLAMSASAATINVTAGDHGRTTGPITIPIFDPFGIPADFFGPGSDPYDPPIDFVGDPLGPGTIDTIIRRLEDAALPNCGDSDTIAIEIVALSLTSTVPITVTFNGGQDPEEWDVQVDLSTEPQSTGSMTIRHGCTAGGDFDSSLPVLPRLTFSKVADPIFSLELDFGLNGIDGFVVEDINAGWNHTGSGPAGSTNFFPGAVPPNCTCTAPICGDNLVNQPSEDCDGTDDAACPGECLPDCYCPDDGIPTVSEWGIAVMALLLLVGAKVYFSRRRAIQA